MSKHNPTIESRERPPIVGIFGHVDHGKSTLLDFIRKSNVVAGEAGGITQHIGAYQASHKNEAGVEKIITFIDTPGHAAFTEMRSRGAKVADIGILVVAADDGVKAQTKEALQSILSAGIPYIIAINKIDKPNANVDVTKQSLAENEIYVEGYGGNIPFVPISAKTGAGVSELLDMILLLAELEELKGNSAKGARGLVIESHKDSKKGIFATVIVQDGTLHMGEFLVVDGNISSVRNMADFNGKALKEASPSSPVEIRGLSEFSKIGSEFESTDNKKEAEKIAEIQAREVLKIEYNKNSDKEIVIPIVIKSDTAGTLEAVEKELRKLEDEKVGLNILASGVGNVSESDIRLLSRNKCPIVIAFNVKIDDTAKDLAESLSIPIKSYNIIYKASEDLEVEISAIKEKLDADKPKGILKVIKVFNGNQRKQVVGGEVTEGVITTGNKVNIKRFDVTANEFLNLGRGKITLIQHKKVEVLSVEVGKQCGIEIETKVETLEGDLIEATS